MGTEKNFLQEAGASCPDYHLMIIWERARIHEKKVLEEVSARFDVNTVLEIAWSREKVDQNFGRFYSQVARKGHAKAEKRGRGPFVFILFSDRRPHYSYRKSISGGYKLMNANVVDLKSDLRKLPGIKNTIHSTSDPSEFTRDMTLLFGQNYFLHLRIENDKKWDGEIRRKELDLVAANGWKCIEDFFGCLNQCHKYVVLRSYESILTNDGTVDVGESVQEIDILTSDPIDLMSVANAEVKKLSPERGRTTGFIFADQRKIKLDVRSVGDGYFDANWQQNMLSRSRLYNGILKVPREDDLFFSLLYHSLLHKGQIPEKHRKILSELAAKIGFKERFSWDFQDHDEIVTIVTEFLRGQDYSVALPRDRKTILNGYARKIKKSLNGKATRKVRAKNILKKLCLRILSRSGLKRTKKGLA